VSFAFRQSVKHARRFTRKSATTGASLQPNLVPTESGHEARAAQPRKTFLAAALDSRSSSFRLALLSSAECVGSTDKSSKTPHHVLKQDTNRKLRIAWSLNFLYPEEDPTKLVAKPTEEIFYGRDSQESKSPREASQNRRQKG
jgi:hypothetical protein